MKTRTYIFFGRSGSGKGTQAELLQKYLQEQGQKVVYLETGQLFRDFIKREDNFSARLTKEVLDHGKLMPPFLPIWLWTNYLVENFTGQESLILDGLSRRAHEAPILDSAMKFYNIEKPIVVSVNVSFQEAFRRLKSRGRSDDTDEYITSRLEWYDKEVLPAIEFFKNSSDYVFLGVNGEQDEKEVHQEIIKGIEEA